MILFFAFSLLQSGSKDIPPTANQQAGLAPGRGSSSAAEVVDFKDGNTVVLSGYVPENATFMSMSPCHEITNTYACGGFTCVQTSDEIANPKKLGETPSFYSSYEECLAANPTTSNPSAPGTAEPAVAAPAPVALKSLVEIKKGDAKTDAQGVRLYNSIIASDLYKTSKIAAVSPPGMTPIFTRDGTPVKSDPSQVSSIELWYPGLNAVPVVCKGSFAEKVYPIGTGKYLFLDFLGRAYFGGAGMFLSCDGNVLLAGNSEEALAKVVDEFISRQFTIGSDSGTKYFAAEARLNALVVTNAANTTAESWVNAFGAHLSTLLVEGEPPDRELRQVLANPAPGGKVVVAGTVTNYLNATQESKKLLSYGLFDLMLFKANMTVGSVDIHGCSGTQAKLLETKPIASGVPAIIKAGNALVGSGSFSVTETGAAMQAVLNSGNLEGYGTYTEIGEGKNLILAAGLSNESVKKALSSRAPLAGSSIPECTAGMDCKAGSQGICFEDSCSINMTRSCVFNNTYFGIQRCGAAGRWGACEARKCCKCFVSTSGISHPIEILKFLSNCNDWFDQSSNSDCDKKDVGTIESYASLPSAANYCPPEYAKQEIRVDGHSYPKNFEFVYNFCNSDPYCRASTSFTAAGCLTCSDLKGCAAMLDKYPGNSNLKITANTWVVNDMMRSGVVLEKSPGCEVSITPKKKCSELDTQQCPVSKAVLPCMNDKGNTEYRKCCYLPTSTVDFLNSGLVNRPAQRASGLNDTCPDFCVSLGNGYIGSGFKNSDTAMTASGGCTGNKVTEYYCTNDTYAFAQYACSKGCDENNIFCKDSCTVGECVSRGYSGDCVTCGDGDCKTVEKECASGEKFGVCSAGKCQINGAWECLDIGHCKDLDSQCASCTNHTCTPKAGECSKDGKFGTCSGGKCQINTAWECRNAYNCNDKGYDSGCASCTNHTCAPASGQCRKGNLFGNCSSGKCRTDASWECLTGWDCSTKGYDNGCISCNNHTCTPVAGECSKDGKFGTCSSGKCQINLDWECKYPYDCTPKGYDSGCADCTNHTCVPAAGECRKDNLFGNCSSGKCQIDSTWECLSGWDCPPKGYDDGCASCTNHTCTPKSGECRKDNLFGNCSSGKCQIDSAWECLSGWDCASKGYDDGCASCTNHTCAPAAGECRKDNLFGNCSAAGKCQTYTTWECISSWDCTDKGYDGECVSCTNHTCAPRAGNCWKDNIEGICSNGKCDTSRSGAARLN